MFQVIYEPNRVYGYSFRVGVHDVLVIKSYIVERNCYYIDDFT